MAIEGEVMTIHQKIQAAHNKHREEFGVGGGERQMKVFDAPKIGDIEEIKQILQYILDKMHGMDLYMRNNMQAKHHRVHDGEAIKEQEELVKQMKHLEERLNANDSKEADSGTGTNPQQVSGSGSIANRQGDFRAGSSLNPKDGKEGFNLSGEKKVDAKPKSEL